jgi:hypothetical protein
MSDDLLTSAGIVAFYLLPSVLIGFVAFKMKLEQ